MWTASPGGGGGEVVFGPSSTKKWPGLEATSGMVQLLKRIESIADFRSVL